MNLREAAQQALEALESIWNDGLDGYPDSLHIACINKLRAALEAEPQDYRTKYDRPCYKCKSQFCPGDCAKAKLEAEPTDEVAKLRERCCALEAAAQMMGDYGRFLKNGETVEECIDRNRKDAIAVTGLLAKAKEQIAALEAEPRIPTGWQLVPKIPTPEMSSAFFESNPSGWGLPHASYKAMLAAAPKLEAEPIYTEELSRQLWLDTPTAALEVEPQNLAEQLAHEREMRLGIKECYAMLCDDYGKLKAKLDALEAEPQSERNNYFSDTLIWRNRAQVAEEELERMRRAAHQAPKLEAEPQEPVGFVSYSGKGAVFYMGIDLEDGTPLFASPQADRSRKT